MAGLLHCRLFRSDSDIPPQVSGERGDPGVDVVRTDAGLRCCRVNVLVRDRLQRIEIRPNALDVAHHQNATELGVHPAQGGTGRTAFLFPRRFNGALGKDLARGLVRPLLRQRLKRGAAGALVGILDGPLGEQIVRGWVRPPLD